MENKKIKTEDVFQSIRADMLAAGYSEKTCVLSKSKATWGGTIIGVSFALVVLLLFRAVNGMQSDYDFSIVSLWVIVIPSIVAHEFLHGIAWSLGCEHGWKSIKITFDSSMPLCHCKEVLNRTWYIAGVLFPFLILGVGVAMIAFCMANLTVLMAAAINIAMAGGDLLIVLTLLKTKGEKIVDHPTEPGFVIFSKS